MTSCKPASSLSAGLSASEAVLYRAAMTAARIAFCFTRVSPKRRCCHRTIEEPHVSDGISPARKIIPRTLALLDIRSPGLLSRRVSTASSGGWTADRGLPLSDQPPACASRNPRRTLLYLRGASRVPDATDTWWIRGNAAETKTCVLLQSPGTDVVQLQQQSVAPFPRTVGMHCPRSIQPATGSVSSSTGQPALGAAGGGLQPRRVSFWSSSRSVRNPEVSRMRPRI